MNVYEIVNSKILAELERGVIPWRKPWHVSASGSLARNLVSGKEYQGINRFLLNLGSGYGSEYFLTYKQAEERGGHVRKGERGHMVVFYKMSDYEREKADGTRTIETYPVLRYYTVFNVEQCEGIEYPKPEAAKEREFNPIEAAERIVSGYVNAPQIGHGGNEAYYSPPNDRITMPKREVFEREAEYYSTLFHEMTHSTRHQSRLDRKFDDDTGIHHFGDSNYSKEELVAEFGAAFLCGQAGIENQTVKNSAAYIDSWRRVLKGSPKVLVMAAGKAQKAADYILGNK